MESFYQKRYTDLLHTLENINRRINYLSIFRLISFLLIITSIILLTVIKLKILGWLLLSISIIAFLGFIKIYLKVQYFKNFNERLLKINQRELNTITYDFSNLPDNNENTDSPNSLASDLNLFGKASLFQFINRCATYHGRKKLIERLVNPQTIPSEIYNQQEICKDLAGKIDWRQKFQAIGSQIITNENKLNSFFHWLMQPTQFLKKKSLILTVNYLPFITFSSLVFGIFTGYYWLAQLFFSIQIIFSLFYVKKINKIHQQLNEQFETLGSYAELMQHIASEHFTAPLLIDAQKILSAGKKNASHEMKNLSGILNALDRRANILVAFILNTVYMADLRNVILLEKWKVKNRAEVDEWLNAIAVFDTNISFATFAFNNPSYVFPSLCEKEIKAVDISHPLIPAQKRVSNDISLNTESSFVILTGANMAGKSTFLRTMGVNLILAMNGAPVCASKFSFKPMKIMTSIAVKDSLFENESYFYAELLRLKNIIEILENGENVFVILDEILKGTNSNDKLLGSFSLMKKLIRLKACGIVATHDTALGNLEVEYPDKIQNLSFEVMLENDKLFYDYKLYQGICKNLNASFLMRKMGIIN